MRLLLATAALIAMGTTSAFGALDALDGKSAKKMLFSHKGSEFVIIPQDFMRDADIATLDFMASSKEFKTVLYYAAIATSPDDGLVHKATVATSDHHTIEAAEWAALEECNRLRGGAVGCVVVAHILPRKYAAQPFQLSASATTAFKKSYLRGKGPKAMAVSPSQGSFAISKGDRAMDAALAACATDGAKDCQIVVQD